ncbi:hypothetical protein BaRGS_00000401 [Batillaria attramentaria]|uniref:Histone acetyltransferase n=1 Tax=Batillaria attramentaria TaxID=370345 RepID=A0ABD0M9C3_9CAEN
MSQSRYADWILETIDHLRKRKARPDLQHICHMVKRRHGLSFRETEACIEKLVDAEIVVKVDYKGNTSYRNAAKWKKSHLGGVVLNSSLSSKKLREAIFALTRSLDKSPKAELSASAEEISSWLQKNFEYYEDLKSPLKTILQREVEAGRIEKLSNGKFCISEKVLNMKTAKSSSATASYSGRVGVVTPARRGRPPKNKKKLKRVYSGDGDSMEVERRPSTHQPEQRCDFCQYTALANPKGVFEALLVCKDCTAKAHPSCMDYTEELSKRARKGPWQCIDCKTCYICEDAGDPDLMLFCDGCDKGYHMNCHIPQVMEKPVEPGSLPLTPAESPSAEDAGYRARFERHDPTAGRKRLSKVPRLSGSTYPDASEWSIKDVVDFFTSAGFSEQAEAFRDQEIDGKSLLLMKRSDVLTGLSIKLGPALKIHRHVQKLQMAGMESAA